MYQRKRKGKDRAVDPPHDPVTDELYFQDHRICAPLQQKLGVSLRFSQILLTLIFGRTGRCSVLYMFKVVQDLFLQMHAQFLVFRL
jgi:hypothetical protein